MQTSSAEKDTGNAAVYDPAAHNLRKCALGRGQPTHEINPAVTGKICNDSGDCGISRVCVNNAYSRRLVRPDLGGNLIGIRDGGYELASVGIELAS
jgi:hypothetical protein